MNDRDDVLKRATEALAEQAEPSADELARLRQRVLAGNVVPIRAARPSPRRQVRRLRWLLPLAAAFFAGTALAATPGAWEGLREAVERYLHISLHAPERTAAARPRPATSGRPAPRSTAAPEPIAEMAAPTDAPVQAPEAPARAAVVLPAAPALAPAVVVTEAAHPRRAARSSKHATPVADAEAVARASSPPAEPAPEPLPTPALAPAPTVRAADAEFVQFRTAYALQHRAHDNAAALRAWDDYLQKSPGGTLALEARYNRALCLVALRRVREARAALADFARGQETSGYKRNEAARLLEALEKQP